jgi:hypothetical protein
MSTLWWWAPGERQNARMIAVIVDARMIAVVVLPYSTR